MIQTETDLETTGARIADIKDRHFTSTADYITDICRDASGIIELTGQINAVMKKEASVIRDMSSLPEKEQVQFWHEEFAPLLTQEHALRETLLVVGQRTSPEST
jgi:hypothetical protein